MSHGTGLTDRDWRVRAGVYRHFAETGGAPDADRLAGDTGLPRGEVEASLDRLAKARLLALAPGSRRVWMAHPFSAVPTDYPVETPDRGYWANCAWDALAIPSLLATDARVDTRCPVSGERVVLRVRDGELAEAGGVIHFLVPPRRFWENVGFT